MQLEVEHLTENNSTVSVLLIFFFLQDSNKLLNINHTLLIHYLLYKFKRKNHERSDFLFKYNLALYVLYSKLCTFCNSYALNWQLNSS